jgi:general secretion pathway protein J
MTRQNGFTLLEVLVTLVVFSLMLAGLTQGVHYGLQAWQMQVRIGSRASDLDAVDRALRHMIDVMDPGDGADPAPITAAPDRLAFITMLPDSVGILSAQRIEATLLIDPSHRLVLRWRPWLHARRLRPPPEPIDTELIRGISRLELSFWRPTVGWVTAWHYPDLPALIRIRVVFPPGDARHWPDIVAAPALDRP